MCGSKKYQGQDVQERDCDVADKLYEQRCSTEVPMASLHGWTSPVGDRTGPEAPLIPAQASAEHVPWSSTEAMIVRKPIGTMAKGGDLGMMVRARQFLAD